MRPSVNNRKLNQALAAALLTALVPSAQLSAGTGGAGSSSTSDIASREIIRRQERIANAEEAERRGDKAFSERDFEKAIAEYRTALDALPVAPMTQELRERIIAKFAQASVELANQRADSGEYESARSLLNNVLSEGIDPGNRRAKKLLERLDDPEWYNPSNSKDHTERVQQVRKHLELAVGHYDLGEYNKAREEFNAALAIDPYHVGARRGLEKLENKISEYHLSARDHARSKMLREVDELWEVAVPQTSGLKNDSGGEKGGGIDGSQVILEKLRTIVLPTLQLDQATIEEAIEFIRAKSKDLDVATTDPAKKGVNFLLKVPNSANLPKISVNLSNIPLGEGLKAVTELATLRYRVDPFAVIISAVDEGSTLYTRTFRVRPDFLANSSSADAGGAAAPAADPFAPAGGGAAAPGLRPRATALDILKAAGIPFPEAASAVFSPATSTVTVRNTPANLDLVQQYVDSTNTGVTKMIYITSKFVEVSQRNTDELGFDWLLGAFNLPGTGRLFGTGGTAGNRGAGPVGSTNWPLVPPASGTGAPQPIGGANLLTGSLRFGRNAISDDAIDNLIQSATAADGGAEASVSPAIFGLGGVFTDPQFQVVMRGLSQKKGTDLLTAPSVMTRSGQKAKIEVIREFIYPTEFDPPEIPQNFGGGNTNGGGGGGGFLGIGGLGGGGGGGGSVAAFPVTPTTPTNFETKNTGITMEVEPTIGADGYTIDLALQPEVIEFEGFINYGSPIQTGATDALGNPTTVILTENRIEQPVFSTRRLNTNVTIWDGMTLGVGGLIREDVQSVEDKVPIFGDIPYIGRLFRTKADEFFKRNLLMFVTVKLMDPAGQPINNRTNPSSTPMADPAAAGGGNQLLPPPPAN